MWFLQTNREEKLWKANVCSWGFREGGSWIWDEIRKWEKPFRKKNWLLWEKEDKLKNIKRKKKTRLIMIIIKELLSYIYTLHLGPIIEIFLNTK